MTQRSLFDPADARRPAPTKPARRERARLDRFPADKPLTITEACNLIKRVLADRTPSPLRVVGEISNLSIRNHWFFSLKDEQSVISAVMWSSATGRVAFKPEDGQQVLVTGRLDFYGPQGRLQLYVDRIEPVGRGALEVAFQQLCGELRKLGYFDADRKKHLPAFPEHIAVITSRTGAALADVVRTATQRWPGVRLTVVDVRVQGAESAPQIAAAIRAVDRARDARRIDAVLLTRGGGSLEDLWAFNDRRVADAIFRCGVPLVAAIGHETDLTIAELVADLRCSTPTQAATRLVADAHAEFQRLDQLTSRLAGGLRRRCQVARAETQAVASHPIFRRPVGMLVPAAAQVDRLASLLGEATRRRMEAERRRLERADLAVQSSDPRARLQFEAQRLDATSRVLDEAPRRRVAAERQRLDALDRQLTVVGPQNVLDRGFSITTDSSGNVVRGAEQLDAGDEIATRLARGSVRSRVIAPGRGGGGRGRRKRSGGEPGGLFDGG